MSVRTLEESRAKSIRNRAGSRHFRHRPNRSYPESRRNSGARCCPAAILAGQGRPRSEGADKQDHRARAMFQIIDPGAVGGGIAVAMFFGILICLAVGRRIGQGVIARSGAAGVANVGSLETAVFALLGLLIAFTFSGALSRFDVRRAQVVDEANAIGTAYYRIDLLPAAAQPQLRETFRQYVDARIATYKALPDVEAARRELARSQDLQREIWNQAVAAI